ncbi:sensor histidine kinase [Anaerocolumna sp. MB42-C2]|uniref:sensor histidine kinase n=1 Tax=Anaerocolumna sp. MB42-C2 TaxID=3070997 RepID=UPI0027DF8EB7|nr:sensor histidine kinase [Anaerocolumna sp. MB42-C2]WMJ86537.1 GHKL domain-containing protein [Anaerocolumna sp. MB42-C2]
MNIFPSIDFVYLFLLQLTLGLVDMILVARLYECLYDRPVISKGKVYVAALLLGAITAIVWRLLLEYYRPTSTPVATVISSFLLLPFYRKSNWLKKGLFSIVLFAVACFWLSSYDLIVTPLPHKNFWLIEVMVHVGFWMILATTGYIGRKRRQVIPTSIWVLLTAISIVSILVYFGMFYHIMSRERPYAYMIEIMVMLVLLFINIALFLLYERFAAFTEADRERYLLEQQLQLQNKYYQQLERLHGEIRTLHHDMRNHLNTAATLVSQGEQKALKQYLQEANFRIGSYEQAVLTGNPALDAIFNIKITELKQSGIAVETDIHIPRDLKITFKQVSTIFGNLLDNVQEACEALPEKRRWVRITLFYINQSLVISIVNAASKEVSTWDGFLPATSKTNRINHGLGLKNVLQEVEPNGSLHIESKPESFSIEIVLYGL